MTASTLARRSPVSVQWSQWSSTMRLVVDDPEALASARLVVDDELEQVERAASRFRADSEIRRIGRGRRQPVSPTFAAILQASIDAAKQTAGALDPTIGSALHTIGYDRDIAQVRQRANGVTLTPRPAPGWQRIRLDSDNGVVVMPEDVTLDLGALAKAWAADRCAKLVHVLTGASCLVSLGGDIATAGKRGWDVLVHDQPVDPAAVLALPPGAAIATSSTLSRRWLVQGRELHHILDPATGGPVDRLWRSASVVAASCVTANTWSTAALVLGSPAVEELSERGLSARLVGADGLLVHLGSWPPRAELPHGIPTSAAHLR